MNTKKCKECLENKEFTEFYVRTVNKRQFLHGKCISCSRKIQKNNNNTPEKRAAKKLYDREYKIKMQESLKIYKDNWYIENRDRVLANRKRNQSKINKGRVIRRKNDICYSLNCNLRAGIHRILKGRVKAGSAVRDLGCSLEFLREHLESKFYSHPDTGELMTWDNRGLYGWHIDHKRPLVSFDLTNREDFLKACHYTNLQPLWAIDNLRKGHRF